MTPSVSHFQLNRCKRLLFRTEISWTIFLWHVSSRRYVGSLVTKLQIPYSSLGIKSLKFRIAFYSHYWDLQSLLMIAIPNQTAGTWFKRQRKTTGFLKEKCYRIIIAWYTRLRQGPYCWQNANQ